MDLGARTTTHLGSIGEWGMSCSESTATGKLADKKDGWWLDSSMVDGLVVG